MGIDASDLRDGDCFDLRVVSYSLPSACAQAYSATEPVPAEQRVWRLGRVFVQQRSRDRHDHSTARWASLRFVIAGRYSTRRSVALLYTLDIAPSDAGPPALLCRLRRRRDLSRLLRERARNCLRGRNQSHRTELNFRPHARVSSRFSRPRPDSSHQFGRCRSTFPAARNLISLSIFRPESNSTTRIAPAPGRSARSTPTSRMRTATISIPASTPTLNSSVGYSFFS